MDSVNIRTLTHNFSKYLKAVKNGKRIIIMERNIPVAEIIPHNANIIKPGWKREVKKVRIDSGPLSKTLLQLREDEIR